MRKKKLGIVINELSPKKVSLIRTTLESRVDVFVEEGKRQKYNIQTRNKFFNHMLAGVASRACLNFTITYMPTTTETLDHVIVEDVGLTLGRTIREMIDARRNKGVNERGSYTVAFDEALVIVTLAFDGRVYTFFQREVPSVKLEQVEDISSTNLRQFFEGFSQGAGCVV